MMDCALKLMNSAFKMMDSAFKMMDFVFKNDGLCTEGLTEVLLRAQIGRTIVHRDPSEIHHV